MKHCSFPGSGSSPLELKLLPSSAPRPQPQPPMYVLQLFRCFRIMYYFLVSLSDLVWQTVCFVFLINILGCFHSNGYLMKMWQNSGKDVRPDNSQIPVDTDALVLQSYFQHQKTVGLRRANLLVSCLTSEQKIICLTSFFFFKFTK